MMRLYILIGFILSVNAFVPRISFERSHAVRIAGIVHVLDGNFGDIIDETEDEIPITLPDDIVSVPVPAPAKKKAAKRKSKTSPLSDNGSNPSLSLDIEQNEPTTTVSVAPTPSKIFYRAKEDNELYAVSAIAIGNAETLKDVKKILVEANEWAETSKVIFYTSGSADAERLAYTTSLSDVLTGNSNENPLYVTILSHAEAPVPVQQEQIDEINSSISLYQSPSIAQQPLYEPAAVDSLQGMIAETPADANVNRSMQPQPQSPIIPGPKVGRGVVLDPYASPPTQAPEWANRLPLMDRGRPLSAPPPPPPAAEETSRFWMNKISLDLGVVLVAKVMKALEKSQFLVLAAPGGYGKTSLLQLLERVYEKQGKCVVRFRIRQDADVYHQFQTSSGIDLKNAYIHDLRPNYQKVILIDDAHKVYDTPGFWEVLLKRFPTWCFAWDYTIILAVTLPVPQGAPIIELLGDPNIPHLGPKDFAPEE